MDTHIPPSPPSPPSHLFPDTPSHLNSNATSFAIYGFLLICTAMCELLIFFAAILFVTWPKEPKARPLPQRIDDIDRETNKVLMKAIASEKGIGTSTGVEVAIKTIKIPEAQTPGKSTQAGDKDRRRATTAGTGGGKEKSLLKELLPRKMIVKSNSIHHREHGARDLGPPLKVRLLSSTYTEIQHCLTVCVCVCVVCVCGTRNDLSYSLPNPPSLQFSSPPAPPCPSPIIFCPSLHFPYSPKAMGQTHAVSKQYDHVRRASAVHARKTYIRGLEKLLDDHDDEGGGDSNGGAGGDQKGNKGGNGAGGEAGKERSAMSIPENATYVRQAARMAKVVGKGNNRNSSSSSSNGNGNNRAGRRSTYSQPSSSHVLSSQESAKKHDESRQASTASASSSSFSSSSSFAPSSTAESSASTLVRTSRISFPVQNNTNVAPPPYTSPYVSPSSKAGRKKRRQSAAESFCIDVGHSQHSSRVTGNGNATSVASGGNGGNGVAGVGVGSGAKPPGVIGDGGDGGGRGRGTDDAIGRGGDTQPTSGAGTGKGGGKWQELRAAIHAGKRGGGSEGGKGAERRAGEEVRNGQGSGGQRDRDRRKSAVDSYLHGNKDKHLASLGVHHAGQEETSKSWLVNFEQQRGRGGGDQGGDDDDDDEGDTDDGTNTEGDEGDGPPLDGSTGGKRAAKPKRPRRLRMNKRMQSAGGHTREDNHADNLVHDCCLLIACHESCYTEDAENAFKATLRSALVLFPPQAIFVCDNGRDLKPCDETELVTLAVSREYYRRERINYVYVPEGNKTHAIYWVTEHWIPSLVKAGHVPSFRYTVITDDDVPLPNNLHIPSSTVRKQNHVKAVCFCIRATTEDGSENQVRTNDIIVSSV